MNFLHYSSPIGLLRIVADDTGIVGLYFADEARGSNVKIRGNEGSEEPPPMSDKLDNNNGLVASSGGVPTAAQQTILKLCCEELDLYFLHRLKKFSVPLHFIGTPFRQRVWSELLHIPYGTTVSYWQIAQRLGDEKAIRAVGTANGHNPIGIIVPCHRVIGSNGQLTGYAGGLWRKQWLLEWEGALGLSLFK